MEQWIIEEIKQLPPTVQERVLSNDFAASLKSILEKHNVEHELTGDTLEELFLFFIGTTLPGDLPYLLELTTELEEDEALALTEDLFKNLLDPIIPLLANHWIGEDNDNESIPTTFNTPASEERLYSQNISLTKDSLTDVQKDKSSQSIGKVMRKTVIKEE